MLPGNTSSKGSGSVRIEMPAAQLGITGYPTTVNIASKHQRRAIKVIRVFREENLLVWTSDLASFLLHYFCCEALAKIVQGAKANKPLSKTLGKGTSVKLGSLKAALRKFHLTFDHVQLKRIFEAADVAIDRKSARALRNAIVHGLAYRDVQEVHNRGKSLITDMERFISVVERASDEHKRF